MSTVRDPDTAPDVDSALSSGAEAMLAVRARAGYMMGEVVEQSWTPNQAGAWEGMLEVSRRLRRDAEGMLEQRHGLSVSMLGIMGRLTRAPNHTLRQTDLAEAMGLSVSRVSRLIDILEERKHVTRQRCPADARATNVKLTSAGCTRTTAAQEAIHEFVQETFFGPLSDDEVAALSGIFTRLLGHAKTGPMGDCVPDPCGT